MSKLKIDFKNLFESLMQSDYVAIKLDSEFPKYSSGQDLDIFCRDIEKVSNTIITFLNVYINDSNHINITKNNNNVHIDLMCDRVIHYRFA
jgi:hypothetical protein